MRGSVRRSRRVSARMPSVTSAHDRAVRISSFCSDGNCIGVAIGADEVRVVDTSGDDQQALRFTHTEWAAFVAGVKAGEFDLAADPH